jgi:anti-sigma B factor antagonist
VLDPVSVPVAITRRGSPASEGGDADRTVVWLRGEHDVTTVPALRETLDRASTLDDADLLVDLSSVEFIGAATVGEIIRAQRALDERSRALAVRAPSRRARRILDVCGLADLIDGSSAGDTDHPRSPSPTNARLSEPATSPPSRHVPVSPPGRAPASSSALRIAAIPG